MKKVELKKPENTKVKQIMVLYGYPEGGTNDAPACDANGDTANCKC